MWVQRLAELAEGIEIVDTHVHARSRKRRFNAYFPGEDGDGQRDEVEVRRELLAQFGVQAAFLMPDCHHNGSVTGVQEANDEVQRQVGISDELRVGMLTVPLEDADESVAELERAYRNGLRGLTLHHRFAAKTVDTPVMWPLLEAVRANPMPVFVHCLYESGFEAPWRLERLAADFPDLTFIALMGMMTPTAAMWVVHIAERYPNIVFETAGLTVSGGVMIRAMCERVGAGRLVYGSDLSVNPQSYYFPGPLFEILASPIGDDDKRAILGENAMRLFSR
jgi:predicted TIM-barrel fold metal-dependent hydrolase